MTEKENSIDLFLEKPVESNFDKLVGNANPAIIEFLKLAEEEGSYSGLSEKRKIILQMRYAVGLSMPEIAKELGITKQAVAQSLKLSPESLFKQMVKDSIAGRAHVPFGEILKTYANYRIELQSKRKPPKLNL